MSDKDTEQLQESYRRIIREASVRGYKLVVHEVGKKVEYTYFAKGLTKDEAVADFNKTLPTLGYKVENFEIINVIPLAYDPQLEIDYNHDSFRKGAKYHGD